MSEARNEIRLPVGSGSLGQRSSAQCLRGSDLEYLNRQYPGINQRQGRRSDAQAQLN